MTDHSNFPTLDKRNQHSRRRRYLDDDVHELHEEVKTLLKKAGLGRLNMNRSLNPIIKSILEDAKYQAKEHMREKELSRQKSEAKQQAPEPA